MNFELTPTELSELKHLQGNVSGTEYIKITSILMLHKGFCLQDISDTLGIDVSTIYRYAAAYGAGGIIGLTGNKYKGYWGLLSSLELSLLIAELKRRVYTEAKSIGAWIQICFGVRYTPEGIVDLLHRIGFTYKKTKEVPCECDIERQQLFMEDLSKLFDKPDANTVIYYADGVHPTHNSRSTHAWIEKGKEFEQPTVSGRDRVNLNALLNAHNVTDIIAVDSERVNAQSTKELYQKAIEKHPKAETIYIISDNARYYKNTELTRWLGDTKIKQIFLPPYSPNLNLIERLWKFLRKKVINTGFYRTKELFRKAIHGFFEKIEHYKPELETLLTLNFRLRNSQSFSF